jgi:tetratricopeptide (TPR) repeat protein
MTSDDEDDTVQPGWHLPPLGGRDLRLGLAREALRAHDPTRAITELEELLDDTPDDVEALSLLAVACTDARDHAVARDAWETLVELGRDRAYVWTQIALCALELAAFDEARSAAEQAVARDEDAALAWSILGQVHAREGAAVRALACFERAHALAPAQHPLPLRLQVADAQEILQQALREVTEEVAAFWSSVPVRFETYPSAEDLAATVPPITPHAVALYEGEPPPKPSRKSRPQALRVYVGNLAHNDSWDTAVLALADALEAEALDWREPPTP